MKKNIKKLFGIIFCTIMINGCSIDTDDESGLLAKNIHVPSASQTKRHIFSDLKRLFPDCDQFIIESPKDLEHPIYYGVYKINDDFMECSFYIQNR